MTGSGCDVQNASTEQTPARHGRATDANIPILIAQIISLIKR